MNKFSYVILILLAVVKMTYCQPVTQTYSTPGTYTYTVPPRYTAVTRIQVWGAGGGTDGRSPGTGGGGGAYSESTLNLPPGNYTIIVGAGGTSTAGGNSSVSQGTTTLVLAAGGSIGTDIIPAPGGAVASGIGSIRFRGGSGGERNPPPLASCPDSCGGGGGGASGRPTSNGANGSKAGIDVTGGGGAGGNTGALSGSGGTGGSYDPPAIFQNPQNGASPGGGAGGRSGTSTTSAIGGNGQVIINVQEALPIELSAFYAKQIDHEVHVVWKTLTELNNSHFILEKSTDGKVFKQINKQEGKGNSQLENGNSQLENSYLFIDKISNVDNDFYYKLKQYDYDNSTTSSKIIKVSNELNVGGIQFFQNIKNESIYFKYNNKHFNDISFIGSVYDINGHYIQQIKVFDNEPIATNTFYPGIYIITIYQNSTLHKFKFVKF